MYASSTPLNTLPGARKRSVDALPHSVLMRELAETRRQLGVVLALADKPDTLESLGWRGILRDALTDAISYRESQLDNRCDGCEIHPAGLCEVHSAHLDQADAYQNVAAILGLDVTR